MATPIDRQLSEISPLLQENKEAVQGIQDVVERGGGQSFVVGGVEPRIDIVWGGACEVPTNPSLLGRRQEHTECLEHANGGLERLGGIMPSVKESEVLCDEPPIQPTQERQPMQMRDIL
jgi:hypothetical protein